MEPMILIVEDDREQLGMLSRLLLRQGRSVVPVYHPRMALQAASFRQFSIALIDLSLPEIDGLDLARRLQRLQESLRVVFISGFRYPLHQARSSGVVACLEKPFDVQRLQNLIERLIGLPTERGLRRALRTRSGRRSASELQRVAP